MNLDRRPDQNCSTPREVDVVALGEDYWADAAAAVSLACALTGPPMGSAA